MLFRQNLHLTCTLRDAKIGIMVYVYHRENRKDPTSRVKGEGVC